MILSHLSPFVYYITKCVSNYTHEIIAAFWFLCSSAIHQFRYPPHLSGTALPFTQSSFQSICLESDSAVSHQRSALLTNFIKFCLQIAFSLRSVAQKILHQFWWNWWDLMSGMLEIGRGGGNPSIIKKLIWIGFTRDRLIVRWASKLTLINWKHFCSIILHNQSSFLMYANGWHSLRYLKSDIKEIVLCGPPIAPQSLLTLCPIFFSRCLRAPCR